MANAPAANTVTCGQEDLGVGFSEAKRLQYGAPHPDGYPNAWASQRMEKQPGFKNEK